MPALPLDDAGAYVAAAYTVFVVLLAIYIAIMAAKLGRISRQIGELAEHVERRRDPSPRGAAHQHEDRAAGSDEDSRVVAIPSGELTARERGR